MFVTSILNLLIFIYLSCVSQLKTGCLGRPVLCLAPPKQPRYKLQACKDPILPPTPPKLLDISIDQ